MKTTKIWLEAATALLLVGLALFVAAMVKNQWNFQTLSTEELETNSYPIRESFQHILIETDTADVLFVPSEDGSCRVVCRETANEKHSVTVRDATLQIQVQQEKRRVIFVGISLENPSITVYLPEAEYGQLRIRESTGDVEIPADFRFETMEVTDDTGSVISRASVRGRLYVQTDTGDIRLEELSAPALELSASTGDITARSVRCDGEIRTHVSTGDTLLSDVRCADLRSEGSTGRLRMENVIAENTISIVRTTGDVRFEGCDAAALDIRTDTGDVSGSLRSEKRFLVHSDTGKVDVPGSGAGGVCEIETDTGDIRLTLA